MRPQIKAAAAGLAAGRSPAPRLRHHGSGSDTDQLETCDCSRLVEPHPSVHSCIGVPCVAAPTVAA